MGSILDRVREKKIRKSIKERDMAGFTVCNKLDCKVPCAPQAIPCTQQIQGTKADWIIVDDVICLNQEQEKASVMNTDTRTEAQQAKDYLIESLKSHMRKKKDDAAKAFHLHEGNGLKTWGDLRRALKNGWVFIPSDYDSKSDSDQLYDPPQYLISIQDPEKRPDREGYEKVLVEINKSANEVQDQIIVFGSEKGLEALNAFKAKTFS